MSPWGYYVRNAIVPMSRTIHKLHIAVDNENILLDRYDFEVARNSLEHC
jgi:hypothetical protein